MYTSRQFKNEAGGKVSRQVECRTRQRVKMKSGRDNAGLSMVISNIQISRKGVMQYYITNQNFKISENNQYATDDSQKDKLYVNKRIPNIPPPEPMSYFKKTEQTYFDTYEPKAELLSGKLVCNGYYPVSLFPEGPNDCGYYAGALADNSLFWNCGRGFRTMMDKTTGGIINNRDSLNDEGYNATPDIREAYFIYPPASDDRQKERGASHHVATVVAKDGADRITSEADCTDNRIRPYFEMYGTKSNTDVERKQTFLNRHGYYFNSSTGSARVAVLSVPRPDGFPFRT